MLKYYYYYYNSSSRWTPTTTTTTPPSSSPHLLVLPVSSSHNNSSVLCTTSLRICFSVTGGGAVKRVQNTRTSCRARRRVLRYNYDDDDDDDDEDNDNEDEDEFGYGHNAEIAMLELYSQSARDEALIVTALVDDQEAQVLIFKGFSSCLSYKTSPNPSRSVLPERAVIKSIDRMRGPFDPSNVEYLEQGLTWETFMTRLHPKSI